MSFDRNNCALESGCLCAETDCYWECPNWGRSSLPMPGLTHDDAHYGVMTKEQAKRHAEKLHERQHRQERWAAQTNERMDAIRRHPREHLRRKGVKI